MNLLNQFWAPRDIYEPTGMFTSRHMVLLVLSLVVLSLLIYLALFLYILIKLRIIIY